MYRSVLSKLSALFSNPRSTQSSFSPRFPSQLYIHNWLALFSSTPSCRWLSTSSFRLPLTHKALTSQRSALLQVIDTLPSIALSHLIPYQPGHHAAHPLLTDDCILRGFEGLVVVVVDAVKGRRDGRLTREEVCGPGDGHVVGGYVGEEDEGCWGVVELLSWRLRLSWGVEEVSLRCWVAGFGADRATMESWLHCCIEPQRYQTIVVAGVVCLFLVSLVRSRSPNDLLARNGSTRGGSQSSAHAP